MMPTNNSVTEKISMGSSVTDLSNVTLNREIPSIWPTENGFHSDDGILSNANSVDGSSTEAQYGESQFSDVQSNDDVLNVNGVDSVSENSDSFSSSAVADQSADFSVTLSATYLLERELNGCPSGTTQLKRRKVDTRVRSYAKQILQSNLHRSAASQDDLQFASIRPLSVPALSEETTSSLSPPPTTQFDMESSDDEDTEAKRTKVSPSAAHESGLRYFGKPIDCQSSKIQDCPCYDLPPNFTRCLECRQSQNDNESAYCRFRDFRKFASTADGSLSPSLTSFVCHVHNRSKSDAANYLEWLPSTIIDQTRTDGANQLETAKFILSHSSVYFHQLLEKERELLANEDLNPHFKDPNVCIPWKDSAGIRELCDVCSTTIFNLHVLCPDCGLCVCSECFSDRINGVLRDSVKKRYDQFGWAYCTRGGEEAKEVSHSYSDMILAHLIPAKSTHVLSTLDELERELDAIFPKIGTNFQIAQESSMENQDHQTLHWHMFDGQVLVLRNGHSTEALRLFQEHWKLSNPLIVQNIHEQLSMTLWRPNAFADLCRDHASADCIVDCRTGKLMRSISLEQFWNGFADCGRRLRDKEKRKLYLKLKDFPPRDKFSLVLREHYEDFCKALPIPEYTHPEHGRFNLATKLPSFCLAPDLGPKMYTAYDMIFEERKGTTNLHLDVSDAVNISVNVTTPANIQREYMYKAIIDYLETQNLDEKDLQRAKANTEKAGALWTIFKPQDNSLIREFLLKLMYERRDNVDDPIHDQKIYLDRELRDRLKKETGVSGFTFVQMLGDAVFIPAGAAHQVQNLLCCIKVAEDFVSPEGVQRCAIIADEFRSLTKEHSNHEDKLQLPNIVTHAVRESISILKSASI